MKLISIIIVTITFSSLSPTFAAKKKHHNPQIISFDGIDVNSSKGSPRDAFVSSKKKADFDYFFNTKMSFKKKILDSLERVR